MLCQRGRWPAPLITHVRHRPQPPANLLRRLRMSRIGWLSIFWFAFLAGAAAQTGRQDYTDLLLRLTELTDNKQYNKAIEGYRRLQARPGTPGWLKAASEYEVAELYGALGQ